MTDLLLAYFVDMVDRDAGSFPITIALRGLVVTGYLVNKRGWLRHMAVEFHHATEKASPGSGKFWLDLEEQIARTRPEERPEAGNDEATAPTLHLKDAQLVIPGMPLMPQGGMWLRVKLNEVDAFAFGLLQPQKT